MKMHYSSSDVRVLILVGLTAACTSESGSPGTIPTVGDGAAQGGSLATSGELQGGAPDVGTGTRDTSLGGAANGGSSGDASIGGAAKNGGASSGTVSDGSGGASSGTVSDGSGGASNGTVSDGRGGASSGTVSDGRGGASSGTVSDGRGGASTGGTVGGQQSGAASGIGGTATGGSASGTGGAGKGGAPTGTGGKATGGVPTGTGGKATGGASTGGVGAAIGGATSTSTGTTKPSSGCSQTNGATGTAIDGTIAVGSAQRSYRLSVPADAVGEPLPLVFGWNGVGGDGKGAQSYFKMETNHRGIFVYPDPNRTDGWDYTKTGPDVAFFDALITYLTQSYCVDMNRIFSLGMSAGGIISNRLGCFRGDVLRAIAPSSSMTWSDPCTGDVAVMVICGTQDSYNACDDAKNGAKSETDFWLPRNGCGAQTTTSPISSMCEAYQGCNAADPVLLCTHSGGHGWPTSLSDATWQFFMGL